MPYVIRFNNGSYNEGSGFEVQKAEATRYETLSKAQEVSETLRGVEAIEEVQEPLMDDAEGILKEKVDLETRKAALDAAVRFSVGRLGGSDSVLDVALNFEHYLRTGKKT